MKTFTVTYHHTNNYGALFQAYALQQAIIEMGYENTIFEYPYGGIYPKISVKSSSAFLKSIASLGLTIYRRSSIIRRDNSFRAFHRNYMVLSRVYESMKQLRNSPPEADCLIVGSDQVWNLSTSSEFIPARLLDFGSDGLTRISYAASIENMNYTTEQKEYVKQHLSRFKGVSLREDSARQYISDIIGQPCEVHLDPVFLRNREAWSVLSDKPRIAGPYILCYQVMGHKLMQPTVDALKKQTGFPVVSVCSGCIKWIKADYTFFDVSPQEFLGLYRNASAIVTSSFHGTAFALVFNKPIYSLVRKQASNRVTDLLMKLGIEDRIVGDVDKLPSIDMHYEMVNATIVEERMRSLQYLKEMFAVDSKNYKI